MTIEIIAAGFSMAMVVLGGAATWGALRWRIRSLEASRAEMGRRIGALENEASVRAGYEAAREGRRRPSMAFKAQPQPDDESGPEEKSR